MRIAVYGAGNGGKLFSEIARQCGHEITCFIDDNKQGSINGCPIIRPDEFDASCPVIIAVMDNNIRLNLSKKYDVVTLIHPTAYVFPTAKIGKGVLIKPNASIGNNVEIGDCCIIDAGVCIEHDTILEEGVFISVGSNVGSSVRIGKRVLIGIGCNVVTGAEIGDDAVICSGATVFKKVSNGAKIRKRL